jgi:hypothetical protein
VDSALDFAMSEKDCAVIERMGTVCFATFRRNFPPGRIGADVTRALSSVGNNDTIGSKTTTNCRERAQIEDMGTNTDGLALMSDVDGAWSKD